MELDVRKNLTYLSHFRYRVFFILSDLEKHVYLFWFFIVLEPLKWVGYNYLVGDILLEENKRDTMQSKHKYIINTSRAESSLLLMAASFCWNRSIVSYILFLHIKIHIAQFHCKILCWFCNVFTIRERWKSINDVLRKCFLNWDIKNKWLIIWDTNNWNLDD